MYGLGPEWLLHEGVVVPDVVVLAHERDRDRLARATPEALDRAVVAGDPCYERMRASSDNRLAYRAALGAERDSTIVTVSSTWGPGSLLGGNPELITELVGELSLDDHIVAAVLHPNVWHAHGPLQIRIWLAEALRSGLRLVPPARGWQQAILASDAVIGDHGAVTGYAAAVGVPTLLASFPRDEVAAGTAIDLLGRLAPRLDPRQSLHDQVHAAIIKHDPGSLAGVTELVSSLPDSSAQALRSALYRLMNLPEPRHDAPVSAYPAAELRPYREQVHACWLACERDKSAGGDLVVRVRRWPADVPARGRRGPRAVDTRLAAHLDHLRRDLRNNADIVVLPDSDPASADEMLRQTLRQRPACTLAIVAVADARYRVCDRRVGMLGVRLAVPPPGPLAAAVLAAVVDELIHDVLPDRDGDCPPPLTITARVGSWQGPVTLVPVRASA